VILLRRRIVKLAAFFVLISSVLFACLALTGCGQEKKEKTAKPEVGQEEKETETTSANTATSEPHKTETKQQGKNETDVVTQVAIASARANNPDLPALRVLEVKIVNEKWAKVVLEPVDGSTDAASWFLEKENGNWTVFDFGTAIMPEDHPDAPAELFK
jgi:hypothetical protein